MFRKTDNKNTQKGVLTIGVASAFAGITLIASGIIGFYSSNLAVQEKISKDRERISKLEANEVNLTDWLKRVERKLDEVIKEN